MDLCRKVGVNLGKAHVKRLKSTLNLLLKITKRDVKSVKVGGVIGDG